MSDHTTLIDWFDRAAACHPQTVALVADGCQMTYEELDASASRAAAQITEMSLPAARVGVVASRTVDTYVAYLAVLRSERTVVPLNPAFPASRTRQMLVQAKVNVVLGEHEEIGHLALPWSPARPLPGTASAIQLHPAACHQPGGDVDAPAYVLFTSGTTGTPKGIPISHANVCTYLEQSAAVRRINPGDRASQCFDLTFDPSVSDMFTTWSAGATLVVPTKHQLRNPVAFVTEFNIAHWSSVPSMISLARRMRQLSPSAMPGLRTSCFAGEALTLPQARTWQYAAPNSRIWNAYGPTEVTITCSAYQLPADVKDWPATRNGTVPIGTPYPKVRWRIEVPADASMRTGELWLAGPQRFDGYLDPTDNSDRFTPGDGAANGQPAPDAFYRTGDNVAETPDGLVHLGRTDQQVQVNGYRVELSEVEGALRRHPAVDDVVAFLTNGELVAVHTGSATDAGAVLDTVATQLPPYMVPSRLQHEPSLPLNGNGKIDRNRVVACLNASTRCPRADAERSTHVDTEKF
jgi:amino acid adenylation domain-containing protein